MSEKALIESLEAQLNGLRKDLESIRSSKPPLPVGSTIQDVRSGRLVLIEGHWITVHSEDEHGHGTHIYINDDGKVGKGPAELVGKELKKAVKTASKSKAKPATASSGLGMGGSMAPSPAISGGTIDVSKYQASIPLTPPPAAKAAPAPKAPKAAKPITPPPAKPSKPAEPANIDISGYKFELPKPKPPEAPKPPEPPKVEAPKAEAPKAEAPKPATPDDSSLFWQKDNPFKPIHVVPAGMGGFTKETHIYPDKATADKASGFDTMKNLKALKAEHGPSSKPNETPALSQLHDLQKTKKNYLYDVKSEPKVYESPMQAALAYSNDMNKQKMFLKAMDHKNGMPEKTASEYTAGAVASNINKAHYLYKMNPTTFGTPDEAKAKQDTDKKATKSKLMAIGVNAKDAELLASQVHPDTSYLSKPVQSNEPPKHIAPVQTPANAGTAENPLDIFAHPTGVKGQLIVPHGQTRKFETSDDAKAAHRSDLFTTTNQFLAQGMSMNDATMKAWNLVKEANYQIGSPGEVKTSPPVHTQWAYSTGEMRPKKRPAGIKGLDPTEVHHSIRAETLSYSSSGYHSINDALRQNPEGDKLGSGDKHTKEKLDEFIAMHGKAKKPMTLWRGVKSFYINDKGETSLGHEYLTGNKMLVDHASLLARFKDAIGKVVTLNGYQSSSQQPETALGFTGSHNPERFIFEIKADRGGLMKSGFSNIPGEAEVLLPHGAKYRVIGIEDAPFEVLGGEKRKIVKLEML